MDLTEVFVWTVSCFFVMVSVTFKDSEPYRRAPIAFVLNSLNLVLVMMFDNFQMFRGIAKLAWAILILYWTSMIESSYCQGIRNR